MAWLRLSDVQIWPQVAHLPRPDTLKAIKADIGGLVTTLALSGPDLNGLELVTSMAKKWKAAGYDRIAMSSDDAKLFSGVLTSKVTVKNKKKKEEPKAKVPKPKGTPSTRTSLHHMPLRSGSR